MISCHEEDISQYAVKHSPADTAIDFSALKPISSSGSTCDAYETRYHQRHVFIKKLKQQYEFDIKYRAAFAKEYEIGCRLNHRSLPHYNEFFTTYFLMDYVEGDTLAKLIKNQDPWLTSECNVRRMFTELLDVVDYLHQNNVFHCDIKTDNVMLMHGTRNLMLIDLDKCYTDWLDIAQGELTRYGVSESEKAGPSVDFNGIGKIVQRLDDFLPAFPTAAFKRFKEECFCKGATIDSLREALAPIKRSKKPWLTLAAIGIVATAAMSAFLILPNRNTTADTPISSVRDTIVIEHRAEPATPKTIAPDYKATIEQKLPTLLKPLHVIIYKGNTMLRDSLTSDVQLIDFLMSLNEQQGKVLTDIYDAFEKEFPSIPSTEIQITVTSSKAYKSYASRADQLAKEIADEMNRRHPVDDF